MPKQDTVFLTLSAAVGTSATFTASYPANRTADDYLGGTDHQISTQSYRTLFANIGDFTVAFGASNITVTNLSGVGLAIGTKIWLNLDRAEISGADGEFAVLADVTKMSLLTAVKVTLGAPATAVANGAVASQSATLASGLATGINGSLASAGVATFDVPRNVVAAWTGAAVLTVTGTGQFGSVIVESSASGTSHTGKKAFKTITSVTTSADITLLTVGTGVVLGLPVFLPDVPDVFREIVDGAVAGAGTVVAGIIGTQTATTGDVRGSYSPALAPNGARVFELCAALRNPAYRGAAQFAG